MSKYCPGHGRHWFTFYGQPGLRSPVCVRCATPNPRPLKPEEWDALLSYRELRGGVLFIKGMEGAITAEQKRRRAAQRKIRDILAEIDAQRAS